LAPAVTVVRIIIRSVWIRVVGPSQHAKSTAKPSKSTVMEPVTVKTSAAEPAGVKTAPMEAAPMESAPMESAGVEPSKSAAMKPATMKPAAASAMWTSISHARLTERSSEYHSSCGFAQKGTHPGPSAA
jgi:hypothetical protein